MTTKDGHEIRDARYETRDSRHESKEGSQPTVNSLQLTVHSTRIQNHFAGWNMDDVVKQVEDEREKKRLEDIARRKEVGKRNDSKSESVGVGSSSVVQLGELLTITVPGFGSFHCSHSPDKVFNGVQSFDFAKEQCAQLQSIARAVAVRSAFWDDYKKTKRGLDHSDDYQRTSTVSLKLLIEGVPHVAFAELDMSSESRDLLQKGHDLNSANKELFLPLNDSLVSKLLSTARDTKRVVPALNVNPLSLSLDGAYDSHLYSIAVFGSSDIAGLNAQHLIQREQTSGRFYDWTKDDLVKMLKGKESSALVRLVGLGGDGFGIDVVYANGDFVSGGRVRACTNVEQKISP